MNGGGLLDGDGYYWWWADIFVTLPYKRPHLIEMRTGRGVTFENLLLKNSPRFHMRLKD